MLNGGIDAILYLIKNMFFLHKIKKCRGKRSQPEVQLSFLLWSLLLTLSNIMEAGREIRARIC